MNKSELENKLKEFDCLDQYSLDGSLDSNRYILYHNYSKWEYFFFNEKGGREYIKTFGIIHFNLAILYITKIRKDVGNRALRPTFYYKFAE